MSNARNDDAWRTYPHTLLEFPECDAAAIDLRRPLEQGDRDLLRDLGLDQPFAVLTAENPCSLHAEDSASERDPATREDRNRERMAALVRLLDERDLHFVRVDGVAPDDSHREHSVAILVDREDAVDLARALDQLAMFWYDGHEFWLYPARLERTPLRLPQPGAETSRAAGA